MEKYTKIFINKMLFILNGARVLKRIFIIDRIEGDIIVAESEDETMIDIPESLVDGSFKEGDILVETDGRYKADEELTKKRTEEINRKFKDLWN